MLEVIHLTEEPHRLLHTPVQLSADLPYLMHARSTNLGLKAASRPPLSVLLYVSNNVRLPKRVDIQVGFHKAP